MPGRHGYAQGAGWVTESGGTALPQNISYDRRNGNVPLEYKASQSIDFIPGFENALGDEFTAYITSEGSNESGNGVDGTEGFYRYGFNGKENDNEVKGEGNQQEYGLRIYDPRLGKFLSVDPLTKGYPMLTPYQFASNSPIAGIDVDGGEFKYYTLKWQPQADGKSHLALDKQVDQVNRAFRTSITVTGINHPTVIVPGSKLTPPILGTSDKSSKEINFSMESLGMSPTVVSPDGKSWRVVPAYLDLKDLPSLTDPIWNTFERPDEYIERSIEDANKIVVGARSASEVVSILHGSIKKGQLGESKLKRYDGAKPKYHINKKHVELRKGQDATKLPKDAEEVFKEAVPDNPSKPKHWYSKNADGAIYRYSSSNDGKAHFSGRSDQGDGLQSISDYAKERLKGLNGKN
jgi:RHS repeat-associated protein